MQEADEMPVPPEIAAKVLFRSDRTCCVCRIRGKPVQIHHIDGDNRNHKVENLAVLCLDCHTETQVKGGFHRKLSPELVKLYRNDWESIVQRNKIKAMIDSYEMEPKNRLNIETLTSAVESLRENKQYELLAMLYDRIGNVELRDKYINKVLSGSPSQQTLIFLRSLQGKAHLVPTEIVDKEIERRTKNKDWSQLARLYVDIGRWNEAVEYYCKGIIESIKEGNIFSAAYYLKEMSLEEKLQGKLFEAAYKKAIDEKDLWWQIRALQELGWNSELDELLRAHKEEIEQSGDSFMLTLLYKSLNDPDRYAEAVKKMYKKMKLITSKSKEPAKRKN